ncbi:hypothetical protein LTR94_032390, partial [Friedmanniomyces endolithicus]
MPTKISSTSERATQAFTISMVEVKAANYQHKAPLQSNPLFFQLKPVSGSTTMTEGEEEDFLADIIQTIDFSIPLIGEVQKYSDDYISTNFTTFCEGNGDVSVYSYLCEDSGKRIFHNCTDTG